VAVGCIMTSLYFRNGRTDVKSVGILNKYNFTRNMQKNKGVGYNCSKSTRTSSSTSLTVNKPRKNITDLLLHKFNCK
jgi:hypothetical protein